MAAEDRYELYLRVAESDDDRCLYLVEQWFSEKPSIETVAALFDEAKRDYDVLYPDDPAEDFSVEVRRLRVRETHPPTCDFGGADRRA